MKSLAQSLRSTTSKRLHLCRKRTLTDWRLKHVKKYIYNNNNNNKQINKNTVSQTCKKIIIINK